MSGNPDRLLAWLLVMPAFLGVLAFRYYPWVLSSSYDLPMAALAMSVAVALFGILVRQDLAARVENNAGKMWLPLACFVAVTLVATALSGTVAEEVFGTNTARGLLQLGALTFVGLFATGLAGHVRRVLYTAAPVVLAIEIAVTIWSLAHGQEGRGTLENTVCLAQLFLLLVPIVLAYGVSDRQGRAGKAMRLALAWGAILVLGLSGSRAGLFLGAILLVFLAVQRRTEGPSAGTHPRWLIWVGLATVALTAAALAGPWGDKYKAMLSGDWLFSYRGEYWRAAWISFLSSPLIGHGPDSYWFEVVRLSRLNHTVGIEALSGDPHNLLLTMLQSFGVLGLAALVWIGVEVWRNWRRQGQSSIWLASGLVAFLLTGLLEPLPLQVLPVFALVLGASVAPAARLAPEQKSRMRRVASASVLVITGILSVCFIVFATAALFAWLPPHTDIRSAGRVQRAADVVHFDPFLYYAASTGWWTVGQTQRSAVLEGKAVAAMERANQLAPNSPFYALALARLYAYYGRPKDTVIRAFERSLSLWPIDRDALSDYARYLLAVGEPVAASTEVRRLVSVAGTASVPADLSSLLGSTSTTQSP